MRSPGAHAPREDETAQEAALNPPLLRTRAGHDRSRVTIVELFFDLVFVFTSWVTNWLDPERMAVRMCLLALMLAGLVLSSSLPEAFAEHGLAFACAYASMQVGRTLFFVWAVRDGPESLRRNFYRILTWFCLSALLWLAGGFAAGGARFALWAVAGVIGAVAVWVLFGERPRK